MKEFRGAAAFVAACASLWAGSVASAPAQTSAARTAVTSGEQAAREDERVRILQDELSREQANAADAARRRAERLAAGDSRGADEADQVQRRTADNLAALRREIAAALKPTSYASQGTPAGAPTHPALRPTSPAATNDPAGVPWWDVYARAPRPVESSTAPRAASVLLRSTEAASNAPVTHPSAPPNEGTP